MAPHSSTLAWRIPWTEEPGGLSSMGLHRVGHDWSDLAAAAAAFRSKLTLSWYLCMVWGKGLKVFFGMWVSSCPSTISLIQMPVFMAVPHCLDYSVCSVTKSCPTLCAPMDCSLPDSSVHAFLPARILEWVAISSSRGYSRPRDQTRVSCKSSALAGKFFTAEPLERPPWLL